MRTLLKPKRRLVWALSALIMLLAAVAAAGGLLIPDLYRGNHWVVTATRGQDLFTLLIAVPAMAALLLMRRRDSLRARLVLIGLIGYMLYTYIGGAFSFPFNEFFLIYVALFSLSLFTLVAAIHWIDPRDLSRSVISGLPRRPVAIFLLLMGVLMTNIALGEIIPFLTDGTLPAPIQNAGGEGTFFVYAMDLGVIIPVSVLSAIWLWRGEAWGVVGAACMLIKFTTMGMAMLVSIGYAWLLGVPESLEIILAFVVISLGGLGMSVWLLRGVQAESPIAPNPPKE